MPAAFKMAWACCTCLDSTLTAVFHSSSVIFAASSIDSSNVSRRKFDMRRAQCSLGLNLRCRLILAEYSTIGSMPMKR